MAKKAQGQTPSPAGRKTALIVGVGTAVAGRALPAFSGAGWTHIRLDSEANAAPDILSGMSDMREVATASVDAVWCPHTLQKLYPHEAEAGLRECFRVLKEGGVLSLQIPDGQLAAIYLAHNKPEEKLYKSPAGVITPLDMLFGFRKGIKEGKAHMAHRCAYGAETLALTLRDAGFTNIRVLAENAEIQAAAAKYSYDHPQRVERVTLTVRHTPKPPAIPAAAQPQAASQGAAQQPAPGLSDPLERPPMAWKPLGLAKKKES